MKHFLTNLLKHPGTWFLTALGLIAIASTAPLSAPVLVYMAIAGFSLGGLLTLPYAIHGVTTFDDRKSFNNWIKQHPWQFLAVGIGIAFFIAALVLTIGFFSGGAGFAFMAPVFAGLAAPFVFANMAGASLSVAGLVGFTAVMMPLILANNLKRFLAWVDSFKYDAAAAQDDKAIERSKNWKSDRAGAAKSLIRQEGYADALMMGMGETLFSSSNNRQALVTGPLTSPDAEKLEREQPRESYIPHH